LSYIGRKPTVGNFQICDAISVVNGQAAYTMQVGSVNVIPQSANHMIVSLNGTIQKPNSSYTVSGSTITFASNLATGDVIDFIQILGDVLDLGVPSDATVTSAKIVDDSVTLAKMASGTDGNIISYDASGNPVAVATGSSGQVLTSAGAGSPPTFADASGGAYEKLVTTSITSGAVTNIEFNNTYITSTYRDYRIVCSDFEVSADSELRMTISDDNGSSYKSASNYRYASRAFKSDATNNNRASSGNSYFIITADNMKDGGSPSDHTSSIIIDIFNPLNTNTFFSAAWRGFFTSSSSLACGLYGGGFYNADASSSFNSIKLFLSSGNLELGSYTLYGRKI